MTVIIAAAAAVNSKNDIDNVNDNDSYNFTSDIYCAVITAKGSYQLPDDYISDECVTANAFTVTSDTVDWVPGCSSSSSSFLACTIKSA